MSSLILQSAPPDSPPWIAACLASVRAWADRIGATYRLLDDSLFDPIPRDLFDDLGERKSTLSDIGRLLWIERLLKDHDAVIWADADVIVFRADDLILPDTADAFGREVWVVRDKSRGWRPRRQIHNAVMLARRGSTFLPFYRQTAIDLLRRHEGPPVPQLVGPKLLTALHGIVGLPVIEAAGVASPEVLAELAAGEIGPALRRLKSGHRAPLAALNLSASLAPDGQVAGQAIERLLADGLSRSGR